MSKSKNNSTAYVRKNMKFREEVVNKVNQIAKKENRTFTNMVETILMRYVEDIYVEDVE